jgi:hypothetical protein
MELMRRPAKLPFVALMTLALAWAALPVAQAPETMRYFPMAV